MKIYTKTGDNGTTLSSGMRVPKHDCSVDGQGEIDELNAWIGMIRDKIMDVPVLEKIQRDLMEIGAQLAIGNTRITEDDITQLESLIDLMESDLPELKNFIIPKSTPEIHVARTVCRRAERVVSAWEAERKDSTPDSIRRFALVVPYLNRLSDYLFVLARTFDVEEKIWKTKT
jgi:cob(I)alamin adenosyltransferase